MEMTGHLHLRDLPEGQDARPSFLLVDDVDLAAALALNLPVAFVSPAAEGFVSAGRSVPADRVHLAALGVLVLSPAGAAATGAMAARWLAQFGDALPARIDLSDVAEDAQREAALEGLARLLLVGQRAAADRSAGLMRDVARLRQEHEAMQAAFARLETHAWNHRLSERKLSLALEPRDGSPVLSLPSGGEVVQRIAGASPGLSDVAIRVGGAAPPRQGVLTCRLESPDLGEVIAEWTIPAARIKPGWLRLSLLRGLADDPVGLCMRLRWEGAAALPLETAMPHPDPRFQPVRVDGSDAGRHVLAMEVWHYLPGVLAPGSAKGWLPDGAVEAASPLRRVEGGALLRAINLATMQYDLGPVKGGDALLVHVMPDHLACAILPEAVAGVRQVSVEALTWHPKGPVVDYAIAVLPSAVRPRQLGALPEFPQDYHSGWVRLRPMRAGQVTLILPDLPGEAHDLYLMTRLVPRPEGNAYGWSTFSGLVMHV